MTALSGLLQHADRGWKRGEVRLGESDEKVWMEFVSPSEEAYEGYYGVISNPLLWFLQHSMWSSCREPTIDQATWRHWEEGYVRINVLFAEAIARQINSVSHPALVMPQDYRLYLAPQFIRYQFRTGKKYTLAHFVHILWPPLDIYGTAEALHQQLSAVCKLKL